VDAGIEIFGMIVLIIINSLHAKRYTKLINSDLRQEDYYSILFTCKVYLKNRKNEQRRANNHIDFVSDLHYDICTGIMNRD